MIEIEAQAPRCPRGYVCFSTLQLGGSPTLPECSSELPLAACHCYPGLFHCFNPCRLTFLPIS